MSYQNNISINPNTQHNNNSNDVNLFENDCKNSNSIELQEKCCVNPSTSKEILIRSICDSDNDDQSTIIDGDSSEYDEVENGYNCVINKNSNISNDLQQQLNDNINNVGIELNQNKGVQIENLGVQNSNDVTIGSKTIYNGPVTINQFVTNSSNRSLGSNQEDDDNKNLTNNRKQPYSILKIFNKSSAKRKKSIIILSSVLIVFIFIIIGIICVFLLKSSTDNDTDIDWNIRIVKRDEWGAKPALVELEPFVATPYRALIGHTVTEGCSKDSSCTLLVRSIQKFMMSNDFDDIGYNFLVGGNGLVYEGCGWDKIGIHTRGYNNNTICVAFMGNYNWMEPTRKQLKAAQWILNESVKAGKLSSDYKLYGVRQVYASDSPGHNIYKIIQKWPHWSEDIE